MYEELHHKHVDGTGTFTLCSLGRLLCAGLLALLMADAGVANPSASFESVLAPAGPDNQRNSEGDVLPLNDGRLLLAWSEYYSDNSSDEGAARIVARISSDQGRTWDKKYTLQENNAQWSVAQPCFLRLPSGKVLFFYVHADTYADMFPMLRISTDDTKTFSPPKKIPTDPSPGYVGFNNDRVIQLTSGRILLPVWYTKDYNVSMRMLSRVYYSDDEGQTWKASQIVDIKPSIKRGCDEPGVVELKDGRVMMWLRTDLGSIYRCFSADQGETWSTPESMDLQDPNAPQSLKRIPSTGDLLLVWTKSPKGRTPLTTAISSDEGKTWQHLKKLEGEPGENYSYTSITFLNDDTVLFSYNVSRLAAKDNPWSKKYKGLREISLKVRSIPVTELYTEPAGTKSQSEAVR